MLPLILALTAQTASLPAGTAEAARLCSATEFVLIADVPALKDFSRALHFQFMAARENRGSGRMLERLEAEQKLTMPLMAGIADAPGLNAACRRRFPAAWAERATLPADPFDRAVTCVGAAATLAGLAHSLKNTAEEQRWQAVNNRLIALPLTSNAEHRKRGMTSTELARTNSDLMLQRSLDSGTSYAVGISCEAAYPG